VRNGNNDNGISDSGIFFETINVFYSINDTFLTTKAGKIIRGDK
jgi:hypothetical protein